MPDVLVDALHMCGACWQCLSRLQRVTIRLNLKHEVKGMNMAHRSAMDEEERDERRHGWGHKMNKQHQTHCKVCRLKAGDDTAAAVQTDNSPANL